MRLMRALPWNGGGGRAGACAVGRQLGGGRGSTWSQEVTSASSCSSSPHTRDSSTWRGPRTISRELAPQTSAHQRRVPIHGHVPVTVEDAAKGVPDAVIPKNGGWVGGVTLSSMSRTRCSRVMSSVTVKLSKTCSALPSTRSCEHDPNGSAQTLLKGLTSPGPRTVQ